MTAAMEEAKGHGTENRRDTDVTAILHYKSLVLDRETHEVYRGYKKIDLTPAELDLLTLFMIIPEKVLSREFIVKYTNVPGNTKLLSYHIKSLREKMGEPALIQTVKGIGYILKRN